MSLYLTRYLNLTFGRSKCESSSPLKRAQGEIFAVADMGMYKEVKEHMVTIPIVVRTGAAAVSVLLAKYTFTAGGNRLDSEIYVFPYQNYLVKVRSTRPMSPTGKNKPVDRLLSEIALLFSKGSIISLPKVVS